MRGITERLKMKRQLLLITILITLFLAGCGTSPTAPAPTALPTAAASPMEIIDGLNRKVILPAPAKRVISMAPSNTETLFAIGAGEQMIGRDSFSDFPVEAKSLTDIGGKSGFDMELIASMKPDLVLAGEINTPEQVKNLENLNIPVFYLSNPKDIQGMFNNVKTVAQLVGREKEADVLIAGLKSRVEQIEQALSGADSRPKVFYELDATEPSKPWTAGKNSFIDQLITMAGGVNAAAGLDTWAQISQEELLVQDPDIIILGDAAYGVSIDQVAMRPGWDKIKAVTTQKIFTFDDNLASRPDPRMVDGLVALVKIIHPELADKIK
jgi:iron complex transport system substrate-binding protein